MEMLQNLVESLPVTAKLNYRDVPVTGIAYHSNQVVPGSLFVCIKGYKTDGHRFLPRAAAAGAVAAVVEEFQKEVPLPQLKVQNSRKALSSLAARFYRFPSRRLKVIGITATNGKTSTAFMTNAVLEENGLKTGLIGTVVVKTGATLRPASLTTPESLDLQYYLHRMVEQGVTHVTMEASSSGLELHRVDDVEFDIVALNNISREHIDLHGSFEAYLNAKARLVREASPRQWAIFNLDCPYSAALAKETPARAVTYGIQNDKGDFAVRDLDLSTGRARFLVELKKPMMLGDIVYAPMSFPVELAVLGLHSVYNSMVAVITGLILGIPTAQIRRALKGFGGVERRFELIFDDEFKVIDDHFANSGNIDVTLGTLKKMDYNRLILVYAIRGNRGVTVNRENAETIVRWAGELGLEEIIATTSNSHVGEKDRVAADEAAVFREVMRKTGLSYTLCRELPEAIEEGLSRAGKGDVILLAGCQGMDHGARLILEEIYRRKPQLGKEKIFQPLKHRVAGM
ncbi:MAG TPA: UDP-N-acetylmuramyl-tripeptide synthetase [Firmicutes bacterium]|nr:UDP-N-acetylmuramyl-tripeptide synthetase [Bacillota bacterium]